MTQDLKRIALSYIEACSNKDYAKVTSLLSPEISFVGPGNSTNGAELYLAVLKRLAPIWVRSDVKKVLVDGDDVAVIYDFVTDTASGSVAILELMHIENGRIASTKLIFDRLAFKAANEELARRAAA